MVFVECPAPNCSHCDNSFLCPEEKKEKKNYATKNDDEEDSDDEDYYKDKDVFD